METAEKVERVLSYQDCQRAIISKARSTIVDAVNPYTGKTVCYSKTLDDCRIDYPDAEEMDIDEFCQWKSTQQRTPITWTATTEERFEEMLNCLPPAIMRNGGFLLGEPYDHDAGNGRPRYVAFRKRGNVYQTANRPMTVAEFKNEVTK